MESIKVTVQAGDVATVKSDCVVVNLFKGVTAPAGATGALDKAADGLIRHHLKVGDFKGDFKEILLLYPQTGPWKRVLLVGLGEQDKFTVDRARQVAARVVKRAMGLGIPKYHTILHGAGIGGLDVEQAALALTEGTILGAYKFDTYKGKKEPKGEEKPKLGEVVILENDKSRIPSIKEAVRVATIISESTNFTREIATLSGDEGTPEELANVARRLAREVGLKASVFDKARCESEGLNGLLAVNRGSAREPRFVILEHNAGKKNVETLVFVGKGITFDSGGISLKPGEKMDEMKFDKSGACAVFGILRACALLDVPYHVVGITPFTENLPSGSAYKPGDVVRALNGKTIEILNTDAEGRVILSDALTWADRYKPAAVVDMATLTGAVQIALGNQCSGMMGNNQALIDAVRKAAERTHERVWELPFFPEYDRQIEGRVGDWANTGGRMAGTITAGKFLEKFIGDYPWVHLDIAATAWQDGAIKYNEEYCPGQATGVGVRLLTDLVRNWSPIPKEAKAASEKGDKKSVTRQRGRRETSVVEERAVRRGGRRAGARKPAAR